MGHSWKKQVTSNTPLKAISWPQPLSCSFFHFWLPRTTWLSCYALLPHHVTMYPVKSALKSLRCWVRIHIFSFKISLSSPGWPWTLTPPALVSLKYSSHLALCSCLLFCTAMGSWKTQNQPLWWFLSNRVASSLLNTWNIANLNWDVL